MIERFLGDGQRNHDKQHAQLTLSCNRTSKRVALLNHFTTNRAGAKTVSNWCREYLEDWKQRMDRVNEKHESIPAK